MCSLNEILIDFEIQIKLVQTNHMLHTVCSIPYDPSTMLLSYSRYIMSQMIWLFFDILTLLHPAVSLLLVPPRLYIFVIRY